MLSADFVAAATEKALPALALIFDEACEVSHGCGCMVEAGLEILLLTSASVARTSTFEVALAGDGFTTRHKAKVVSQVPELNACFAIVDLVDAAVPSTLSFGDDAALSEGDFVIAMGNPQGDRDGVSLGLLVGRSSSSMNERPEVTPGTVEAAMAEAEAEAEAEACARGEEPFLVTDAAPIDGASGGPLLGADGTVVGVNTLVISAAESTRYYAISSRRCQRYATWIEPPSSLPVPCTHL